LTGAHGAARRRLDEAGATLLDRGAAPSDLYAGAHALYAVLSELTGIREDSRERADLDPIRLDSGVALAPRDAARSVVDFMRTARILQGLETAIAAAGRTFGTPVEVLYAGCGPFAPMCLPLAARLGPGAARFTLLDIHARSVDLARRAVGALGLEESVRGFVHADATEWRHAGPEPIHVLVVEALERALEKEPQVRIVANLAPQLAPGGLMVPERIRVRACLADLGREVVSMVEAPAERRRLELGTVFELNADTARALGRSGSIPDIRLAVPDLGPDDPRDLVLATTLVVFGDVVLGEYESGITYPAFQQRAGRMRSRTTVEVRYQHGPDPRFACRAEPGDVRPAGQDQPSDAAV
jgi:hypothetical protein